MIRSSYGCHCSPRFAWWYRPALHRLTYHCVGSACAAPSTLNIILQCGLQEKLSATRTTRAATSRHGIPQCSAQGVPQFNPIRSGTTTGERVSSSIATHPQRGWLLRALNAGACHQRRRFGTPSTAPTPAFLGAELELWLKLPAGFSFAASGLADSKFLSSSNITGYLSARPSRFAKGHSSVPCAT